MEPEGALVLRVHVLRVDDGYVAVCECGHRSEPRISTEVLKYHVEQTWREHILERHIEPEEGS